ncbi:hypothetical protein ACJJTC_014846 [Scirpophaga incertulas]
MHYIAKYFDKFAVTKTTNCNDNKVNVFLYCNYYSFYSQKVLMALYEKGINFEPIEVDITKGEQYSSWFLKINPRGEVPVLKVNNETIPDSSRILDYLELYYKPESPPLINVTNDKQVLKNINKFLLKSGDIGSSKYLRKLAEENPAAKGILLYKADMQERKRQILSNQDEYLKILNAVDHVLSEVELLLQSQNQGNWLCCETFTIADINLAILLQRLWELGLENRFWANGKRPLLEKYYKCVKQRNSFKQTIPSLPFHIKMIFLSQPVRYVGAAGAVTVGVVALIYILKKIV